MKFLTLNKFLFCISLEMGGLIIGIYMANISLLCKTYFALRTWDGISELKYVSPENLAEKIIILIGEKLNL